MNPLMSRLAVLAALTLTIAATRIHHFAPLPDASWAVFFAAGFWLRGHARWAFPWLMAVAVIVDAWVISRSGIDFWSHYCVSPGYWMLAPAYFSLWAGGSWLRGREQRAPAWRVGELAATVVVAVAACHFFAQGGFYWLSSAVAEPSVSGWLANYGHWFGPYLRTTAIYVTVFAGVHVGVLALQRHGIIGTQVARP